MPLVPVDIQSQLYAVLAKSAKVEGFTRDSVKLRFATPSDAEQFRVMLVLAQANVAPQPNQAVMP